MDARGKELREREKTLLKEVEECLKRHEFLEELLRTDAGTKWLSDHEKRRQVDEFLEKERTAETEGPSSQKEIVDRTIRQALGKSAGAPITDEDLSSLSWLYLRGTGISDAGLKDLRLSLENCAIYKD